MGTTTNDLYHEEASLRLRNSFATVSVQDHCCAGCVKTKCRALHHKQNKLETKQTLLMKLPHETKMI